jgi:hypothetical protein
MIARGQLESVPVAGMVFVVKASAQRLADVLADKRAA